MEVFDGRKIRDEILDELKNKISILPTKQAMAVFLVGDDPVSVSYVNLKQKLARQVGIDFQLFRYPASASQSEIVKKIEALNHDEAIQGIMVQIPLPLGFDRDAIIAAISLSKDIDGLRYCQGLDSDYYPPVVCAIIKALEMSKVNLKEVNVALIGYGFLVGKPLERYLSDYVKKLVIANSEIVDLQSMTKYADVIISAVGQSGIIKSHMVKDGVVLIDAGTSEIGGELRGDIDPEAYKKAAFYTPVPGGIGPVTVAMLLSNLIKKYG